MSNSATVRAVQQSTSAPIQYRRKFLSGEIETYATVLVATLAHHFGNLEWFDWEPETLNTTVEEELKLKMPEKVRNKIWALLTALTTDQFYRDPVVFNHVCNSLSGGPVPLGVFEPAELDEMAWGVLEVLISDLDQGEHPKFSVDVATYVGVALKDYGVEKFPPLEFALGADSVPLPDAGGDPAMTAAWVEGRVGLKQEILAGLETNVRELHEHLKLAGLSGDHGK